MERPSPPERHYSTAKARVDEVVQRFTPRKAPPPAPVGTDKDE